MGSCSTTEGEKSYWLQAGLQEKAGSIRKRRGKIQGSPGCKMLFTVEGVDYDEIFSPVVRHTSIRALLALVACLDMILEQMDVKTTFLHGNLEEQIYMKQPGGFEETGQGLVCKLKRSLYGLKQSPRQWYKRFDSYMLKIGFVRCEYD